MSGVAQVVVYIVAFYSIALPATNLYGRIRDRTRLHGCGIYPNGAHPRRRKTAPRAIVETAALALAAGS